MLGLNGRLGVSRSAGKGILQLFQPLKKNTHYYSMLIIAGEEHTLCLKVIQILEVRLVRSPRGRTVACSRSEGMSQNSQNAADVRGPFDLMLLHPCKWFENQHQL